MESFVIDAVDALDLGHSWEKQFGAGRGWLKLAGLNVVFTYAFHILLKSNSTDMGRITVALSDVLAEVCGVFLTAMARTNSMYGLE